MRSVISALSALLCLTTPASASLFKCVQKQAYQVQKDGRFGKEWPASFHRTFWFDTESGILRQITTIGTSRNVETDRFHVFQKGSLVRGGKVRGDVTAVRVLKGDGNLFSSVVWTFSIMWTGTSNPRFLFTKRHRVVAGTCEEVSR